MGARRRAEEERQRSRRVKELAKQIPGGSEQYASNLYGQTEREGLQIMRLYGLMVDMLRLLLGGSVAVMGAGVTGALTMDITARWAVLGVVFGVGTTLLVLTTVLRGFPEHLGALVATDARTTGRALYFPVILAVVGQCIWIVYPIVIWLRSLLRVETTTLAFLAMCQGLLFGSLPGLLLVILVTCRLPQRAQEAAAKIWVQTLFVKRARQVTRRGSDRGRSG